MSENFWDAIQPPLTQEEIEASDEFWEDLVGDAAQEVDP